MIALVLGRPADVLADDEQRAALNAKGQGRPVHSGRCRGVGWRLRVEISNARRNTEQIEQIGFFQREDAGFVRLFSQVLCWRQR